MPVASRSIPACAGEPRCLTVWTILDEVYPRVCGGTGNIALMSDASTGLSPRVRGNPRFGRRQGSRQGSIPACAGEPASTRRHTQRRWVYPRVCGGTSERSAITPLTAGLSPRVRGNLLVVYAQGNSGGSIPACAGEPTTTNEFCRKYTVYPRVCGGTTVISFHVFFSWGLSPRVRGNRRVRGRRQVRLRSIPACAGEPPFHCHR